MRAVQLFFAAIILFMASVSFAQKGKLVLDSAAFVNKNEYAYDVIKLNPMALLCGPTLITSELGLIYEFSLSKKRSAAIGVSWLTKNVFIYAAELSSRSQNSANQGTNVVYVTPDLKISGYRVQAHYKFIFPVFNTYPSALHVGPHASFSTVFLGDAQNQFNTDYYRIVHQNVSIIAGYQFVINKKIFMDIYNGIGYKYNYMVFHKTPTNFKREEGEFVFTGIPINIKFSLGINIGLNL